MTLEQALQYLEITSRVSCPQITCDQAREIAELMRGLADQHQVDIAEMVSWKIHAQVLHERDEARAKLREVERERDGLKEALDVDPNVEWQRRCLIAEKEQNEGWFQFANVSNELSDTRRDHEILRQIACGFAWDAGREMAVAENTAAFWEAQHAAQKRYHRMVAADKAEEVDRLQEQAESLRRQLDAPVEAAPDFDADDYAKPPGKR